MWVHKQMTYKKAIFLTLELKSMEVIWMRLFECWSYSQIIQQPRPHVDPQLHPHHGHGVRNPGVLRRERGGATESAVSVSVSGSRYEII